MARTPKAAGRSIAAKYLIVALRDIGIVGGGTSD
jgi:hypothetical protein